MNVNNVIQTSKQWANDGWNIASTKSKKLVNDVSNFVSQNKKTVAIAAGGVTAVGIAALLYQQGYADQLFNTTNSTNLLNANNSNLNTSNSIDQLGNDLNNVVIALKNQINQDNFSKMWQTNCNPLIHKDVAVTSHTLQGSKSEMIGELFDQVTAILKQANATATDTLKNYTFDYHYDHDKSGWNTFFRICAN